MGGERGEVPLVARQLNRLAVDGAGAGSAGARGLIAQRQAQLSAWIRVAGYFNGD